MEQEALHRFAVIADAHFHDPGLDYGFEGFPVAGKSASLRLPGDVARSPRIYNEAGSALRYTLERLAGEGIRDVVLLGDYSDDGQQATLAALIRLLDRFRSQHGMRFFALPGNHDIFGRNGRHRRKRYADAQGESVLVTSDAGFEDARGGARVIAPAMHCGGYPDNLPPGCGFFADPPCHHWETPFGTDPDPAARTYPVFDADGRECRRLMDASYLIEPVPGLWLVMIDANCFAFDPDGDDELHDSTSAGWNALLTLKPFMLPWLADITRRAGVLGKQVVHFSHYPVLETLDGTLAMEVEMMGEHAFHRRMPPPHVGHALLGAGMHLHFSGHVHVNNTAMLEGADGSLVNIAVPALVAFPAAVKIVAVHAGHADIGTMALDAMPMDANLLAATRALDAIGGVSTGRMFEAETYGDFLDAHLCHVTGRRFLKREWPDDLTRLFRSASLSELLASGGLSVVLPPALRSFSALDFLVDWYRVRAGGALAFERIGADRIAAYRTVADAVPFAVGGDRRIRLLVESLGRHLDGQPSQNLRVNLATGQFA